MRKFLCLLLCIGCAGRLAAQTAPDATTTTRLAALARVWGYAKYFHPQLMHRSDIDFDSLLVRSVTQVVAARSRAEYAAAVQLLFDPLHDPLTRVENERDVAPPAPRSFSFRMEADSTLVISLGDYAALGGAYNGIRDATARISSARSVVLDLRVADVNDAYGRAMLEGSLIAIERKLATDTLSLPAPLRRVYYGYETVSPFSSGQYRSGSFIKASERLVPSAAARAPRAVLLLNRNSAITPGMRALHRAGRASIVYEGDVAANSAGFFQKIPLGDSLYARVRTAEMVFADGESAELVPDVIVAEGARASEALGAALRVARGEPLARAPRARVPFVPRARRENSYGSMSAPALEYRLLSVFRFWNVIEHFYPYKELLDRPWADVLPEFIPIFAAATGEEAYARAVLQLATRVQDSHTYAAGATIEKHFIGTGYPGVRVRLIQDSLVVTSITDTTASNAGVAIGDVVLTIDGEDASKRFRRFAEITSASTTQSRNAKVALAFLTGLPSSRMQVTVRKPTGREVSASLVREYQDYRTLYHRERTGEIIHILPGNVGYVDLDRLTYDMIDSMFTRLANTRGIIFDMRGYPAGTLWAIAPRLASARRPAAWFRTPTPGHDSPGDSPAESFIHFVEPAPADTRYTRPTIMLIDERSVSQAEHAGLFLKAANGTKFVGSATAGANGEIANFTLPGGITVGFTGQAVMHPDGRQLQRIGLQPDHVVRPTIAGIRRGVDEVLEAASKLLRSP